RSRRISLGCTPYLPRSQPPKQPRDRARHNQFVNRRGMHTLRRWDQPVRKTHSPGQGSGLAVIAIARKQASDAPDSVAQRRGGRAGVKNFQQRNFVPPRQPDERRESRNQSSEPRKSVAAEKQPNRIGKKFARR